MISEWLREAAWVFLAVNYLNVLPVPPLDGAHVVQAMMPVRAARLTAAFVVIASLIGAALAIWAGVYLLAVLALFQLMTVRSRWQLAGVLERVRADARIDPALAGAQRERRLFEVLDDVAGPTPNVCARLALATAAKLSVDLKPMRPLQRGLITAIYTVLLAVPLGGAVVALAFLRAAPVDAQAADNATAAQAQQVELRAQAQRLGLRDLLTRVPDGPDAAPATPLAAPVKDDAIGATEQRLGSRLPPELSEVYRIADGASSIPLLPLAELRHAGDVKELDLAMYAIDGKITFWPIATQPGQTAEPVEVSPQQASRWLLLGKPAEPGTAHLYDAGEPPLHANLRLYALDVEGCTAASSLRAWLESQWVIDSIGAAYRQAFERAHAAERTAVAEMPLAQLLDEFERPAWWRRLRHPQLDWPGPASDAAIRATERRLGHALPDDLSQMYSSHNGFPPLMLLDLDSLQPFRAMDVESQRNVRQLLAAAVASDNAAPPGSARIDPASIDDCISISGVGVENKLWVTQLWCPTHAPEQRYVDGLQGSSDASYTDVVRRRVAIERAARTARYGYFKD